MLYSLAMQHVVHVAHEAHKAFDPERDGGAIVQFFYWVGRHDYVIPITIVLYGLLALVLIRCGRVRTGNLMLNVPGAVVLTLCLAPFCRLFFGRVGSGVLAAMTIANRRRKD